MAVAMVAIPENVGDVELTILAAAEAVAVAEAEAVRGPTARHARR